jgi:hypothetical protein
MTRVLLLMVMGIGLLWGRPSGTDKPASEQVVPADQVLLDTQGPAHQEDGLAEIPEAYRKVYLEKKPDGFLVDPQRILSPVVRRDRLAFLDYHAGDSSIDLYLYVLSGDQRLPEAAECGIMMENFFSQGKASALVVYPFGAPDRAVSYLSPALAASVPDAENKRALASSVMQAVEKSDPAGQLEAFLVQMSIRLYWMEKMVANEHAGDAEVDGVVAPKKVEDVEREGGAGEKLEPLYMIAKEWIWEASLVFGVIVLLVLAMVWSRFRARHVLPDFSVEPRLGGEHGAGVGAVISFASASVPPASQRGRME